MNAKIFLLAMIPLLFTGCASIFDSGPKTVHLDSNPQGAKVTIYDRHGSEVSVKTTPATATLNRGGFYHSDSYRLTFEMPGYKPYEAHINSQLDPWYVGNLFVGGLLGMIIIDPATGDMWTISPRSITCDMIPATQASALEPAH